MLYDNVVQGKIVYLRIGAVYMDHRHLFILGAQICQVFADRPYYPVVKLLENAEIGYAVHDLAGGDKAELLALSAYEYLAVGSFVFIRRHHRLINEEKFSETRSVLLIKQLMYLVHTLGIYIDNIVLCVLIGRF